ncbi:hypothetical protein FBUS_01417 [Fasciolopsis buskii]|uniref:AIMP2 thioredoxin-like domain-containing protein n=1 Tax=Fasciolopsis buskii TaxID=27845 RepID=A0A8E0RU30_9TREM|nr:hypothetical protein FBUS_01417 [Fasciolopsis buski]
MYAVRRLIEPVCDLVHTDNMYYVKPFFPSSLDKTCVTLDDLGQNLGDRLNAIETTVSHLLELFKQAKKSPIKPKAMAVKPAQVHPVASLVPSQKLLLPSIVIVVQANPDYPPISALLYCQVLALQGANIALFSYTHSTVSHLPKQLQLLLESILSVTLSESTGSLCLRIVWTRQCPDCITFTDIQSSFLYGESMLIQRLLSLTEQNNFSKLNELLVKTELGFVLNPSSSETTLNLLRTHPYLTQETRSVPSALDCFLYVCARKSNVLNRLPSNWRKVCSSLQSLSSFNTFFSK